MIRGLVAEMMVLDAFAALMIAFAVDLFWRSQGKPLNKTAMGLGLASSLVLGWAALFPWSLERAGRTQTPTIAVKPMGTEAELRMLAIQQANTRYDVRHLQNLLVKGD